MFRRATPVGEGDGPGVVEVGPGHAG
jgi:hypothetical protein